MEKQIVVYKASDGGELSVRTDGETIWMTIDQMVRLFGRDRTVLVRHVNNAIKEGELQRDVNVQKLHNIQSGRGRPELVYDLDVMISVGYRVKSLEGVRFRRWATRILREMLLNRLDEVKRIGNLERRMVSLLEGKSLSFHELQEQFISSFKQENETMREGFKKLSLQLIKQLIKERIILMKK